MSDSKFNKKCQQDFSGLLRSLRCNSNGACRPQRFKSLGFESLENRRMLTVFSVSQLDDSPVTAAGDAPGTLRQAIFDANASSGLDTINFQESLAGVLTLTAGELKITDAVNLVGPGANQLTIDASGNDLTTPGTSDGSGSRILNIDDGNLSTALSVNISGLTLTGGDVSGDGGGILTHENLTLSAVKITDNAAVGAGVRGGGIFSYGGNLTIDRSTISGNVVSGANANGGGVYSTTSLFGAQSTSITNSILANNHATGSGGGVFTGNNLGENQTTTIVNSTLSGNTAGSSGGGLFNFDGTTEVRHTTITDNSASLDSGGGLASFGDVGTLTQISSSIISGNLGGDLAVFAGEENSLLSSGFNVVGTGNSFGHLSSFSALDNFTAPGDQANVLDPGLEPLADNGGPTFTHALTPTSLALDAGDPMAQADLNGVPEFDQRLLPFGRISDGNGNGTARIDVGAYEVTEQSADFDRDGDVDGADFLTWQRGFGLSSANREEGDANNDQEVNDADLSIWANSYDEQATSLNALRSSPQPLSADVQSTLQSALPYSLESEASENSAQNIWDLPAVISLSLSNIPRTPDAKLYPATLSLSLRSTPLDLSIQKELLAPATTQETLEWAEKSASIDNEAIDRVLEQLPEIDLKFSWIESLS